MLKKSVAGEFTLFGALHSRTKPEVSRTSWRWSTVHTPHKLLLDPRTKESSRSWPAQGFLVGLVTATLFAWNTTSANEFSVVEVRRNIQMSEDDPVQRDYYLNAGSQQGLKANLVLQVYRRVPVRDTSGGQSLGDLQIPVGQVRVLYVQDRLAIAREYQYKDRQFSPVLDQHGILVGDRFTLKDSFVDGKKMSPFENQTQKDFQEKRKRDIASQANSPSAPTDQSLVSNLSSKNLSPAETSGARVVQPPKAPSPTVPLQSASGLAPELESKALESNLNPAAFATESATEPATEQATESATKSATDFAQNPLETRKN